MGSGRDELEEKIILALKNAPGVERNGKGLRVVFHYNGIRCRESFAIPVTVKNIKYCYERLVAIKHLIAINQFDYVQFFPNSKRAAMFSKTAVPITLEKLWELFKRHTLMDVKSSTLSAYEDMFHVISGIIGKSKVVSQITDKDVLDYRYIIREGKSATTANVRLSILKRLLIYAEEYGYMTKKLSKHCIRFKERRRKPDPFTKSEIRRALNCCNDAFHKCYLIVAVYTGMRTGEICALCWEDDDLDSATITVRSTIRQDQHLHAPKTGNERIVNLLPPAVDALREMQSLTFMLASAEVRFYDTATNL
ncbi:hypothetical protein GCM10023116_19410 [Kistimonas scapharcae]|uniref:Integrase n=1 Tax=Kistimonas scapharcae TaxID=1036133 RepID=A0ABP8V0F0_9GAMM